MRLKDLNKGKLENMLVDIIALVIGVNKAVTREGKEYLIITAVDSGVTEEIRIFNKIGMELQEGLVYEISCRVKEYKGNLQLNFNGIKEAHQEHYPYTSFLNIVDNLRHYMDYIENTVTSLAEPFKGVVSNIYCNNMEKFRCYPAAKKMHHEKLGGLAMHTATMLKSAKQLHDNYPHLDLDLIYSIIILHDIGKTEEYNVSKYGKVEYSVKGSLLGHISIMAGMMAVEINNLGKLDKETHNKLLALQNGVLSHHGRLEWGSPVKPATAEATLVHQLDMIDAEMYKAFERSKKIGVGELTVEFDNRPNFNTHFNHGPANTTCEPKGDYNEDIY